MKTNRSKPITILTIGLLWVGLANAQESINTAGGNAKSTGGSVDYSIGQMFYTNNLGSTGSVAQGVQHSYEIFSLDVNESELHMALTVFPNPTTENLTVQLNDSTGEKLYYQMYDIQGKLISTGQLIGEQTQIITSFLPSTTYFLNVVNHSNKKVQSFKIIKN